MICVDCRRGHHAQCRGGTWCCCQHRGAVSWAEAIEVATETFVAAEQKRLNLAEREAEHYRDEANPEPEVVQASGCPYPFPGDDLAERLPDGGWRLFAHASGRLVLLERLPRVRVQLHAEECPAAIPVSGAGQKILRCNIGNGAIPHEWHIAVAPLTARPVAVWRSHATKPAPATGP